VTVKEAAAKLGVATVTVFKWVGQNRIPGVTIRAGHYVLPDNAERPPQLQRGRKVTLRSK
jgi:excisionase family DNA binding protein